MQICLLAEEFVRSLQHIKQLSTLPAETSLATNSAEDNPSSPQELPPQALCPQDVLQSSLQLQAQFQEILSITTADDMDPQLESRLRPLQTEAHRRLRLLTMEATKLQAAKQPATIEKTRSQLNMHLDSLLQFAQGITNEVCK